MTVESGGVGVRAPYSGRPTRISAAFFAAKVSAFRVRRVVVDMLERPPRLRRLDTRGLDSVVAESNTPLWSDETPEERAYQLGKIQNLRVACKGLDGLVIPAGTLFSFWRAVGPPIAGRGYVRGRMLQEGCMVAAVGGGLCQLSNALYDTALQAGCQVIERHAHSRVVPGSAASVGRDATVAWNYVDLRFIPDRDIRLSAHLSRDRLTVRFHGASKDRPNRRNRREEMTVPLEFAQALAPRSCATCHETECHRHVREDPKVGVHAFLVDEAWPEFRSYVNATREPGDRLGRPANGHAIGLSRYDWNIDGFGTVVGAPLTAVHRSLGLRVAGRAGGAARKAELVHAEYMARALSRLLTYDVDKVTVAQSYLPHLWLGGHLGGREVCVLMTSLPMAVVESRLDEAAARRPDCATLRDFRAPPWMVQAEAAALAACSRIITPHVEVAAIFGGRAVKLPWREPAARALETRHHGGRIAFPGPTVARKGAYAVRQAAMTLNCEVVPLGAELEGADFWRGVRTARSRDWSEIDIVVQPAVAEHQPRRLLAALAAGLPVIASKACGIDPRPGLTLVPPDDADALIAAIRHVLSLRPD